ncbi:MAG: DUF2269 family protein [Chloroflexota bacterium]|nr:MAG: DUF2269 family protein [Chloroflexota bacterium]
MCCWRSLRSAATSPMGSGMRSRRGSRRMRPVGGLRQGWILAALILFVLLIVVAIGFYSRVIRQQIKVMDSEGLGSAAYKRLDGQATIYGIISLVIALLIVFLMVVKPF